MVVIKNKLFQTLPLLTNEGKVVILKSRSKLNLNISMSDVSADMRSMEAAGFIKIKEE